MWRSSVLSSADFGMCSGLPFCPAQYVRWSSVLHGGACAAFFLSARGSIRGSLLFRPAWHTWRSSILSGAARYAQRCSVLSGRARCVWRCSFLSCAARCARWCCGFVIGRSGSLVVLPDDPVVISASDPRSRRWSCYAAQRCEKVGQGR